MEQIDYKEKYEQALERARQFSEKPYLEDSAGIVEYIFPEFAESEDERIRKALIRYFTLSDEHAYNEACGVSYRDIVAWLEKQGEQKPTDKVEQKFKVGDEIKTKNEESFTITRIDRWGYWSEDLFICNFDDADKWELVEQKTAWSEKNKKFWVHDDDIFLDAAKMIVEDSPRKSYGGVHKKEIVPWFLSLKERLKSLKDRVHPQQEWNEEDEKTWKELIEEVKDQLDSVPAPDCRDKEDEKVLKQLNRWLTWLKSLRPQSQWKPSNEQIEALDNVIAICSERDYETECRLDNLRQDLKKLMEE